MDEALLKHVLPEALAILQEDPKKPTQADLLVGMVSESPGRLAADVAAAVELFHDPGGNAYATIPMATTARRGRCTPRGSGSGWRGAITSSTARPRTRKR